MQGRKLIRLTYFLILFLWFLPYAKSAKPFVVTHVDQIVELGHGVEYLRDNQQEITISKLLQQKFQFETFKGSVLNFGNSADRIWLKFDLNNQSQKELYLQIGNPELDEIAFYGVANNQILWQHVSGAKHPFDSRYMMSNKVCLPIGTQSCTIYIAIQSRSGLYLPLYLGSLRALSDINHKDDLFNGSYLGIMLIMLFYNLFIFLSVRDRLYLQYCLYLLSSTVMMLFIKGLQFDLLWRHHYSINSFYFTNIAAALTTALAIWFSSSFLNIKTHAPKLKWLNLILLILLAVSIVVDLMGLNILANKLVQATSGITSLYLLILGIKFLFNGFQGAKYYVLSWGTLVTGAIVYLLTLNGLVDINFWTLNSFQIASMSEGVLLSFALADRINAYREEKDIAQKLAIAKSQENEQLIRNQNLVLEKEVEIRTRDLRNEMEKSESLLLNILPVEVAQELKETGASEARLYSNVTVMFTDFANFTGIGQNLSPKDLVHEIHHCFEAFDRITMKYGLEKIKTIGDAYLAVGGMPLEDPEHAKKVTMAALEMMAFIKAYRQESGIFEMRIGINSGPVVAGIVGIKKFAYDIWGDTVNTANRMESNGEVGKVNISQSTYELLKDLPSGRLEEQQFEFEFRGKIAAKGKGEVEMWFVAIKN